MTSQYGLWLEFALQQIAAESYLDEVNPSFSAEVQVALERGNTLFTALSSTQSSSFVSRYQLEKQQKNDSSGFSATLLLDRQTGEYTLSFRSTEYANDRSRDVWGADAGIASTGFAFASCLPWSGSTKKL